MIVHKRHTTNGLVDTLTVLPFQLEYYNENNVLTQLDLTNVVAGGLKFKMVNKASGKVTIPLTATGVTFTASTAGIGQYLFDDATFIRAGIYYGYIVHIDSSETNHYPYIAGDLVIEFDSDTETAQEAYMKAVLAGSKTTVESEMLSNFPETLIIGDSYTSNTGQIKLSITDGDGDPITALGTLNFADATITFTAFRPSDSATIVGTCTFVSTATESYVLVSIPATETLQGKAEYTYEGRLKFFWEGVVSSDSLDSDDEQKTYKTTPFKFIANP